MIRYDVHVQNKGWMCNYFEGEAGGTTGQSLRMEAIIIYTELPIKYRVHIQNQGWQDWKLPGEVAGTTGQSLRLEAIEIRKQDGCTEDFNLYYRLHVQNVGWYAWAQIGEVTGTTGESRRAEAIQITTEQPEAADSIVRANALEGRTIYQNTLEVYFQQGGKVYSAAVEDAVTLQRSKNAPSMVTCTILRDEKTVEVGNLLFLRFNKGHNIFKGYVFKTEKHGRRCDITAYDQLIYMQMSKDSRTYKDKRADEVLLKLIDDFKLHALDPPQIANTKYKIPERVEDNVSLLDMTINALDLTAKNGGGRYWLWDDYGSITLHREDMMAVTTSFASQGYIENFNYVEDLSETYTVVKVRKDKDKDDKSKDYIEENKDLIASFGRIQYYEKAEKDEDGAKKAKSLYKELSQIKRTFTLSGVQGDVRVRGGSPYYVDFFNQDRAEYIRGWYRVNSVTHHFKDSTYTMDMDVTLIGDMDERGWKAGEKWIKEGA